MNKACAICQHYYWDSSDIFNPPEFCICPTCASKVLSVKSIATNNTGKLAHECGCIGDCKCEEK